MDTLIPIVGLYAAMGIITIGFAFLGKFPFGWDPKAPAKFFFWRPVAWMFTSIHKVFIGILTWMLGDWAYTFGLKKRKKKRRR